MKKVLAVLITSGVLIFLIFFSYGHNKNKAPNRYYKIYLSNEVIGVVDSKSKLEKFIDAESESIKKKYKVDKVYVPEDLIIEKLSSYEQDVMDTADVYRAIIKKSDLTIDGYQINIKNDDKVKKIYVTREEIFKDAVVELIKTYVGSENYDKYISSAQQEILDTGSIIKNIYVQDNITIKKMHIPVSNKIYSSSSELSKYLLYGYNEKYSEYEIKKGDTIKSVALKNEISTEEFLIANPTFNDATNLLHIGEKVTIAVPDPQISVVVEQYQVLDKSSNYVTEERYDPDLYVGTKKVLQDGANGVIRVSQNVQSINGSISYIEPVDRVEIKQPINKIVLLGSQPVPDVGDLNNWGWPTMPGYTITDDFEWRTNPITRRREHHSGIDIAGTGYGSPIYAANNGVVITRQWNDSYGYYVVINHNNGYWTLYGHMSRFSDIKVGDIVIRGRVIGYVGSTGDSSGPHLHFEVWKGCNWCRVNPFSLYE